MSARRIAIVGPTASGKTRLAVELSRRLGDCELVSLDAMAVYRGLDIGTAKPTLDERAGLAWHLLDVVEPDEPYTVAQFQTAARAADGAIQARCHRTVYVGGTGLYHRAAVDGLELAGRFEEIASGLWERAATSAGIESLYAELLARDPLAASKMNPTNARRIVRALEVTLGTGRPFSSFGDGLDRYRPSSVLTIGLAMSREALDERIRARLQGQLDAGWLEEVRRLRARYGQFSTTASQALGYRELFLHLDGELTLEAACSRIEQRTRRFARRQQAWFRRDPRVVWVNGLAPDLVDRALAAVRSAVQNDSEDANGGRLRPLS